MQQACGRSVVGVAAHGAACALMGIMVIAPRLSPTRTFARTRALLRRVATISALRQDAEDRAGPIGGFVDVHCHLTHPAFGGSIGQAAVIERAKLAGVSRIVVNGLEPSSNREVLELCAKHEDILEPALGIYPLDACANAINPAEFSAHFGGSTAPAGFDLADELAFIDEKAATGSLTAIGEAGLDGMYGYNERLLGAQEEVLRELCRIARRSRLPIIVHSRAAEVRVFRVLQDEGVELAVFHCYMGKKKLALEIAAAGYSLSIPSFVVRNQQLQGMVKALPRESLLTETDAPYLAPSKGDWPNEPQTVCEAVAAMAKARGGVADELRKLVIRNYERLFVARRSLSVGV